MVFETVMMEKNNRKRWERRKTMQRILIVDDNPENLMVTRSLLKRTAVFVDTAASGEAGCGKGWI